MLEAPILQTVNYPNSQIIYSGYYTFGGEQRFLPKIGYLWTSDAVDTVKAYYEKTLPKFEQNSDEGGIWWQSGYTNQPSFPQNFIASLVGLPDSLTHEGISIALIDLSTPTVAISPQFMMLCNSCKDFYSNPPINSLYKFDKSRPSYGTWIIYRYYVYVPYLTYD